VRPWRRMRRVCTGIHIHYEQTVMRQVETDGTERATDHADRHVEHRALVHRFRVLGFEFWV